MSAILVDIFRKQPALEVTRFKLPNAKNYHFSVLEESSGAHGFGGAETAALAQTKAVFEWIERKIYRQFGRDSLASSSGWAAHSSLEKAKLAAEWELLERDALLCSWLKQISPKVLSMELFPAFGKEFPVLQFGHGNGFVILGVVLELDNSRMLISTTAANPVEGLAKLLIDSERAHYLLKAGVSDEVIGAHHEAFCALSPSSLYWLFTGGEGVAYGDLQFSHTSYEAPLWDGSTAWISHATCGELQPLFFGPTASASLNHARLSRLPGQTIHQELHPLL